jgi:enamine deaminase RidA (YjgF/YER057c/UK114 family)
MPHDAQYLEPPDVAPPPDPYTNVIRVGRMVLVAGQVAIDEQAQVVGRGDPLAQAEQTWRNIERCLASAGAKVSDVVKVVAFLKDIRHMEAEMTVRKRYFEEGKYPVYTMVQVANLAWESLLMEIDVTAMVEE